MANVKNERFRKDAEELVTLAMKKIRSIGNIKRDCRIGKRDMDIFFSVEDQEKIIETLRGEIDNLNWMLTKSKNNGMVRKNDTSNI
mgnify:CR=1 FL=1